MWTTALPVTERNATVSYLEGILCDPPALAAHLRTLDGRATPLLDASSDEQLEELIGAIVEDHRRLHALGDAQLALLAGDALALEHVARDVASEGGPAWGADFTACGAALLGTAGAQPAPPWCAAGSGAATLPASGAGGGDDAELGEVLAGPPSRWQQLVFDGVWPVAVQKLTWLTGMPERYHDPREGRRAVTIRLQAFLGRGGARGKWVLGFDGSGLGDDDSVTLGVHLSGSDGGATQDQTENVILGHGMNYVELTGFGDPTPMFSDFSGDGPLRVRLRCSGPGPRTWEWSDCVPRPGLTREAFAAWHVATSAGRSYCIGRLAALVHANVAGRHADLLVEAVDAAGEEVFRSRYREFNRCADTPAAISQRLFTPPRGGGPPLVVLRFYDAVDRLKQRRRCERVAAANAPNAPGPHAADATLQSVLGRERRCELERHLASLAPARAAVFRMIEFEGMTPAAVADALKLRPGYVRVLYMRAKQDLVKCGWDSLGRSA